MVGFIRKGLAAMLLSVALQVSAQQPWDALHKVGVVVLMRHAITDAGIGDPAGFRLDQCSTQRNLSPAGRAQAERFGAMLTKRGITPVAVFSSAWCRCMDTAKLAFPNVKAKNLRPLDSAFRDSSQEPAKTAALRDELGRLSPTGVTLWVTHQVNVTALTGEYLDMGEALVLKPLGQGRFDVVGRLQEGKS